MQRHPAFQDLSRDHFTGLLACLRVTRAIDGHPQAPPLQEATDALLRLWDTELGLHFDEEDEDLLPILDGRGPELAAKLRSDHAGLRSAFGELDGAPPAAFAEVAATLRTHIRWEEDVLFEWLQENLEEAELDALWQKSRQFRVEKRGPDSVQDASMPR